MTEIVTATDDFNLDFEYSFDVWIDIIGGKRWNPIIQKMDNPDVDWDKIDNAKLVIFTGGEDINPAIYGHENMYSWINYERDAIELAVLKYTLELGKKILGICRGHQLINAYLGGLLTQDLKTCLKADHEHWHDLTSLYGGGKITDIFSEVNSLHHQGVTKAGSTLLPTSSHKGVIESCESNTIITTQFHPEFMNDKEADNFFKYIKSWASIGA